MISGTGSPWLEYTDLFVNHNKTKNQSMKSYVRNNKTFLLYFYKLLEYQLNMYEWVNVPKEIDVRYMEIVLVMRGAGVFFKDDITDKYIFVDVALNGKINMYHQPVNYRAYSFNLDVPLNIDNSVICYNNFLRMPSMFELEEFAERIADIQRTIDINLQHHKMPIAFASSPKNKLSFKNLWLKITSNEPYVMVDKELTGDLNSGIVHSEVPYIIDKLQQQKMETWNEAMTYIGLDNANTNKKERMISDEVNSNNSQIEASRYQALNARREFCKLVNEMFGLNMWVKFRYNQDKTNSESEKENPVPIEEEKETLKDVNIKDDKEVVEDE